MLQAGRFAASMHALTARYLAASPRGIGEKGVLLGDALSLLLAQLIAPIKFEWFTQGLFDKIDI